MDSFVAVLMGGGSSERSVSIASGKACADGLTAAGYRVARLEVTDDIAEKLLQVQRKAGSSTFQQKIAGHPGIYSDPPHL